MPPRQIERNPFAAARLSGSGAPHAVEGCIYNDIAFTNGGGLLPEISRLLPPAACNLQLSKILSRSCLAHFLSQFALPFRASENLVALAVGCLTVLW